MEYLQHLAYIALVLLIGTLGTFLAYSLKTSDIFILILTGMVLRAFGVLSFQAGFISIVAHLALIFIVFNSCTKFKIGEIKKYIGKAIKINTIYFLLCITILSIAVLLLFPLGWRTDGIILALLFSVLAYGTDPTVVLSFFKGMKNKTVEIIELESIINTPLTVIISVLLITALNKDIVAETLSLNNPGLALVQSIVVGIVLGAVFARGLIYILKDHFFGEGTHLGVFTSAIIVYVAAEFLGGSGVLAIAVFGVLFGNSHIAHLIEIEKFESILTNSIKILTFMILGTILFVPEELVVKGTLLFIVYLTIRYVAVSFAFGKDFSQRKRLFLTLNVPKGIDVAVVLLLITALHTQIDHISIITGLTMIMILYSIALSTITAQFSGTFLRR
jgi:cell volume regulation protein A